MHWGRKKAILLLLLLRRRRSRKNRLFNSRREWVRSIFKRRRQQGEFHNLLQELRLVDPDSHFRYLRMSKETFDDLLRMVCLFSRRLLYFNDFLFAIGVTNFSSQVLWKFCQGGDFSSREASFNTSVFGNRKLPGLKVCVKKYV